MKPTQQSPNPEPAQKSGNQPVTPPSPTHQRPPADNERRGGAEQDEKARRSNLAGDQDTDEPVETEEG